MEMSHYIYMLEVFIANAYTDYLVDVSIPLIEVACTGFCILITV